MAKISESLEIPVAADRVWGALADFGNIHRFHPGLKGSHLKGDQASGVGAMRQCDLSAGAVIVERVTDWQEGTSYTIDVTETSLPLKRATTTLSVAPAQGDGALVTMTMDYTPKYGPIGALMDVLAMRSAVRNQMKAILSGLSSFVRGAGS